MPSTIQLVSALMAMAYTSSVEAAMGPAFSTGPVGSNSWIRESTSTLTLPKTPSTNGIASLWVGMGTSNGDLIQSIADRGTGDNWSIYAYTLLSTGPNSQRPVQTTPNPARAGDKVTMHYTFSDSTGNYTQSVLLNGKQVATLSTSDGHAMGWGSAVECAENNCGTIPAHTWTDTKIILNTPDPNYKQTNYKGAGVTGDMKTTDGGKTWTVSTIQIPQFTFGQ